jgi:hypothetical protein
MTVRLIMLSWILTDMEVATSTIVNNAGNTKLEVAIQKRAFTRAA